MPPRYLLPGADHIGVDIPKPVMLCVEPHPHVRRLLSVMFREAFTVIAVAAIEDAATETRPAVIIMDMSDMSSAIRQWDIVAARCPGVPIVVVTTAAFPSDIDGLVALGAAAVLPKPFPQGALRAAVASAVVAGTR